MACNPSYINQWGYGVRVHMTPLQRSRSQLLKLRGGPSETTGVAWVPFQHPSVGWVLNGVNGIIPLLDLGELPL